MAPTSCSGTVQATFRTIRQAWAIVIAVTEFQVAFESAVHITTAKFLFIRFYTCIELEQNFSLESLAKLQTKYQPFPYIDQTQPHSRQYRGWPPPCPYTQLRKVFLVKVLTGRSKGPKSPTKQQINSKVVLISTLLTFRWKTVTYIDYLHRVNFTHRTLYKKNFCRPCLS